MTTRLGPMRAPLHHCSFSEAGQPCCHSYPPRCCVRTAPAGTHLTVAFVRRADRDPAHMLKSVIALVVQLAADMVAAGDGVTTTTTTAATATPALADAAAGGGGAGGSAAVGGGTDDGVDSRSPLRVPVTLGPWWGKRSRLLHDASVLHRVVVAAQAALVSQGLDVDLSRPPHIEVVKQRG
jgi:hypothetical protein